MDDISILLPLPEVPEEMFYEISKHIPLNLLPRFALINTACFRFASARSARIETEKQFKKACKVGDYLAISSYLREYLKTEKKIDWNLGLYGACKGGHIPLVKLAISKGANDFNWGLYYACLRGHIELAEFMIQKGAKNFNSGLYWACLGGRLEIAELMISKGAKGFNYGLYGACRGCQLELVELMISKGADKNQCVCGGSKH